MRPQAVRRKPKPTGSDWDGLAVACAMWAVAVTIIYIIATVPAGWWIPGGLPWTH